MVLFHRQPGFLMVRERSSSHRVCYTYLLMWSGHERFFRAKRRWFGPPQLVYRLLNPLSFVAFKMGRLRGGPSRTGAKGAYPDRYVTDEQRSSRPIFNATLRAAASWLFFRVARSTVMIQIAALRSRLEKQPTDLRRSSRDLGDGTRQNSSPKAQASFPVERCIGQLHSPVV